jgi:hypothetical protein
MDDSPIIVPVPELSPGTRAALVIATARYDDPELRELRSPVRDAHDLAAVLGDPAIGGFTVTTVIDQTDAQVRLAITEFLDARGPQDTVLVYLSCHGIQDQPGRLYFAATNTLKARPRATAVKSADVLDELDECRARQQILILDCCFSGAFGHGGKGELDLERQLLGHGRGRVVLTASRAYEYSFEGKPLGKTVPAGSVFTTGFVEGLRTGSADSDGDGYIAWDEAFAYADQYVLASGFRQTPQQWLSGGEGAKIILARSPAGRTVTPAKVPEGLTTSLASGSEHIRIGAVNAVAEWLADPDPARGLAATRVLREVADHDNPRVAAAARAHLDRIELPTAPEQPGKVGKENPKKESRRREFREWVQTATGIVSLVVALVALSAGGAAVIILPSPKPSPSKTEGIPSPTFSNTPSPTFSNTPNPTFSNTPSPTSSNSLGPFDTSQLKNALLSSKVLGSTATVTSTSTSLSQLRMICGEHGDGATAVAFETIGDKQTGMILSETLVSWRSAADAGRAIAIDREAVTGSGSGSCSYTSSGTAVVYTGDYAGHPPSICRSPGDPGQYFGTQIFVTPPSVTPQYFGFLAQVQCGATTISVQVENDVAGVISQPSLNGYLSSAIDKLE